MAKLTLAQTAEKIAQEALGLCRFYPEAAENYKRAKGHREFGIQLARRNGQFDDEPSRRDYQIASERCDRHWQTLSWLRVAVAGSFPDLHLRLVPMDGKPWHQQDGFDWPEACTELQRVVDAAVHALDTGKPKSRAWCHTTPPSGDSDFALGPLAGNQSEVAAALDMDWRTAEKGQDRTFYIQEKKKGEYTVYFQHQAQLADASQRLEDFRTRSNAQQQTATRNPSKKKRPK